MYDLLICIQSNSLQNIYNINVLFVKTVDATSSMLAIFFHTKTRQPVSKQYFVYTG